MRPSQISFERLKNLCFRSKARSSYFRYVVLMCSIPMMYMLNYGILSNAKMERLNNEEKPSFTFHVSPKNWIFAGVGEDESKERKFRMVS